MKYKKLVIFIPSIEGGGVEKNLFLISNYFSKKIENLTIITTSIKYKKKFSKKIKYISLKGNFWDNFGRIVKCFICLFLLLKQILKEKNVVVFAFQANLYCIILCKLLSIKVIIRSNSSPSGWSKSILKTFLYKIILSKADKIVVNSKEFQKELKIKFKVGSECIYNPLNKTEIIKLSMKKKLLPFFNTKKLKILNIGRLVDQKDQITLLRALNILKNKIEFEALIIGNGIKKNYLLDYINKNNLSSSIKLIGYQENPYPFIRKADLMVHSAIFEGLPNVLLEAITLNKYVISTNCPTGPAEILCNGKAGELVEMKNYKKLSEKIKNFYYNKQNYNKKKNLARKNLKRFDYKKNLEKYFILVNSLLMVN